MKLIVNKGLNNALSKISIIKNSKEEIVYPPGKDYCELNLEDHDKIVVSLKLMDSFKIKLISFSYPQEKNILYIEPTIGKTGADWDSAPEQTGTLLMRQS